MNPLPRINWLRWWWPVLLWAALIFSASSDSFSGEHTSRFLIPLLHWLFPALASDRLAELHLLLRKLAHVGEYLVFSMLLVRGIRSGRRGWRLDWAIAAVAAAAGWAGLDELHQAFVPSRGPSMIDVFIDTCGAIAGQFVFAAAAALRSRWSEGAAGVDGTPPIV